MDHLSCLKYISDEIKLRNHLPSLFFSSSHLDLGGSQSLDSPAHMCHRHTPAAAVGADLDLRGCIG